MARWTRLHAVVVAGALAALSGCAEAASAKGMTLTPADLPKELNPDLSGAIAVAGTSGGESTNPLWASKIGDAQFREALLASLRLAGMLGQAPGAPLALTARILEVDQPLGGLDLTVKTVVRYTLVDARTGARVIDEPITASHTATFGDAFAAVTRLKLANEGSARKNLAALVARLNGIRRRAPGAPAM